MEKTIERDQSPNISEVTPDVWLFSKEPKSLVSCDDFNENLGIKNVDLDNSPHILLCGKSRSGKSSMIS